MQHARTSSRIAPVALALALAAVAGCSGSSTAPSESTPTGSSAADTGTVETTIDASTTTLPAGPPVDELTAESCTFRWFDRYDVVVAVPDDIPKGTEIDVQLTVIVGDTGGTGGQGTLVVDGPGRQTVELRNARPNLPNSGDELSVYRHDSLSPAPGSDCYVMFDGDAGGRIDFPTLAYDIDPSASDGTPFGDLITPADETSLMFPLAELMWLQPTAAFDRLYLAPDLPLDGITVQRDGVCRIVRSFYTRSGNQVIVQQRHGCPEALGEEAAVPGFASVTVPDDNWEVTVGGPAAGVPEVADALRWIDVPGGEPADGSPRPSADEWIDGYLASHEGVVEVGRFDFHGGKVAVVDRSGVEGTPPLDRYLDPVVFAPSVNYAASATPCQEYTVGIASSAGSYPTSAEPGGYAYFVARDPGMTLIFLSPGLPPKVVPQQSPTGAYVAFVDIGEASGLSTQYVVYGADGKPVPCTQ